MYVCMYVCMCVCVYVCITSIVLIKTTYGIKTYNVTLASINKIILFNTQQNNNINHGISDPLIIRNTEATENVHPCYTSIVGVLEGGML